MFSLFKLGYFALIFLFYFSFDLTSGEDMIKEGDYRIENALDGLVLTTQSVGANVSFARVVAENWLNFREQQWNLRNTGDKGYLMQPERFRANNPLTYFVDPRKKFPTPVFWKFFKRNSGYQIESQRTKFCLASQGRRVEVAEVVCDKFQRSQQWKFTKI